MIAPPLIRSPIPSQPSVSKDRTGCASSHTRLRANRLLIPFFRRGYWLFRVISDISNEQITLVGFRHPLCVGFVFSGSRLAEVFSKTEGVVSWLFSLNMRRHRLRST